MGYDELYHHGVPGQKHGVRNGPPYPLRPDAKQEAGYKLTNKDRAKLAKSNEGGVKKKSTASVGKTINKTLHTLQKKISEKRLEKKNAKEAAKKAAEEKKKEDVRLTRKNIRKMSDEEIRQRIERINLEKKLIDRNKDTNEQAKTFTHRALEKIRDRAVDAALNGLSDTVKSMVGGASAYYLYKATSGKGKENGEKNDTDWERLARSMASGKLFTDNMTIKQGGNNIGGKPEQDDKNNKEKQNKNK